MSVQSQDIVRLAKGARATLADLRIVLRSDSIPCPECDDNGTACLQCLNAGWIIPEIAKEE